MLRAGWYAASSSEYELPWLVGIGLISLALNPLPVEAQLVASTTVTPNATVSNTTRVISFKKAPEQWSVSHLPLLEGQTSFIMYRFIFIE